MPPRELRNRGLPSDLARLVVTWEGTTPEAIFAGWDHLDAVVGPAEEMAVAISNVWKAGHVKELRGRGFEPGQEKLLIGRLSTSVGDAMRRWGAERYFVWAAARETDDELGAANRVRAPKMEGVIWGLARHGGGFAYCEPPHPAVELVGTAAYIAGAWSRLDVKMSA